MISALLATATEVTAEAGHAVAHGPVSEFANQFGIEKGYLAWQLGSFSILALVLYNFGIKPLLKTMDERQTKIEQGLKFSDDIKVKLAEAEKSAEAALAKASADASALYKKAADEAKAKIEAATQEAIALKAQIQERGHEAVALERAKMLAEVRAEVARLVVATSAKVLSRELSADEKARYAESAAQEIAAR